MPSRDRSRRPGKRTQVSKLRIETLEKRALLSVDEAAIVSSGTAVAAETGEATAEPPVVIDESTVIRTILDEDVPVDEPEADVLPDGTIVPGDKDDATVAEDAVSIDPGDTGEIEADGEILPPIDPLETGELGDLIALSATADTSAALSASAAADLVPVRIWAPPNLDWDETFVAEGTLKNEGNAATTAPFRVDVYASSTARTAADAMLVGSFMVPAGLAAGATHDFTVALRTPGRPNASLTSNPSYYLTLALDATNVIAESNEINNAGIGFQGVDATVVTVTPRLPSRLVPAGLSAPSTVLDWGGTMRVVATVRNEGPGTAPPTNARIVLAPFGDDPFGPRGYTIGSVPIPSVPGFQTVSASQEIRLPQYPPTQLANVGKFVVMMVSDSDAVADPMIKPINYQGPGLDWTTALITPRPTPATPAQLPDLSVSALTTPSTIAWDQIIEIKVRVENAGQGDAGPFKIRLTLVQSDDPNAPALALGDLAVAGLAAGQSHEATHSAKLPASVPAGLSPTATVGRIVARIDPERVLDETRLENNRLASLPVGLRLVASDQTQPPSVTTTPPPNPSTSGSTQSPENPGKSPRPTAAQRAKRERAILKISERARQVRAAQAERLAQLKAARAAQLTRKAELRLFPRLRADNVAGKRRATVRILPINQAEESASDTNQSA